jgi:hypothetical protein
VWRLVACVKVSGNDTESNESGRDECVKVLDGLFTADVPSRDTSSVACLWGVGCQ